MRKSIVSLQKPVYAGVIKERTVKTAVAAIHNCVYKGATGIDLHLSCLDEEFKTIENIRKIVNASKIPVIALNYNLSYDNGFYESTEEERTSLLLKAAEAGAAAVDIQGYTFDLLSKNGFNLKENNNYSFAKGNPKEIVVDDETISKQIELINKVHGLGAEVILSIHPGIPMAMEQVVDLALFVEKRSPDIIKIVTLAETDEQMIDAFKTMIKLKKEVKTPVSYHCSGSRGALTRIINPILGGSIVFCNERYTLNSDHNQPLLETAKVIIDNLQKIML